MPAITRHLARVAVSVSVFPNSWTARLHMLLTCLSLYLSASQGSSR